MKSLQVTDLAAFAAGQSPLLLDVREPWETALARIDLPGAAALDVPMGQITQRLDEIGRDRPVVCICHHGVRSAHVATYLVRQGFAEVYNLSGGIDAWSIEVDARVPRY